jgi:tetratricopeptide (TPR) repeat protein
MKPILKGDGSFGSLDSREGDSSIEWRKNQNWGIAMQNTKLILIISFFFMGILLSAANVQAVSEEARRHYDRGLAAVEIAKNQADYEDAIAEFEQVARLAPDWPDVYYNLGIVQEKIGRFEDALKNLRRYLELSPRADNTAQITQLINKIEYKKEKTEKTLQIINLLTAPGRFKCISNCNNLMGNRANAFRLRDGKLEAHIHILLRQEDIWVPVTFDGRYIEYEYTWYHCSSAISSKFGYPDQCPWNVSIKSEIISTSPLRLKSTEIWSRSWGHKGDSRMVIEAEFEKINPQ